MITNADVLKNELYDKIAEINDEKVLQAIKIIIDNIKTEELDEVVTTKRDLTGYIKEWVKSI